MWQPYILQKPPFSGLSPLSSKIFGTPPPPSDSFLEGPTPPLIRGRGGPTMDRLLIRPFYESNSNPREKLLWIEKPEANLDRIITSFDGTIILNGHTNNDIKKNTYKHQAILIFINTSNNK